MNKRVLVTGAGGFIGKHLCQRLVQGGAAVQALIIEGANLPCPAATVNLEDAGAIRQAIIDYQPDCVVHLAAIANVAYDGDIADIYRTNVVGTENLLEAIRGIGNNKTRLILTSTAGVYGNQECEFYNEDLPFKPANHYSFSKMVTEYLCQLYQDDFEISIIRPFNITGPGQTVNFLIPKLIQHYVEKQPVLNLGNIDSYRDFVGINFMVEVLWRLIIADKMPKVMNICSGSSYSCRDILGILTQLTGFAPEINISSEIVRRNEVWRLVGDTKKLFAFLEDGLRPDSIEVILKDMISKYHAI